MSLEYWFKARVKTWRHQKMSPWVFLDETVCREMRLSWS